MAEETPTPETPTTETRSEIRAERKRVGEIRRIFDRPGLKTPELQDLMLDAIETGWSVDQTRERVLEHLGRGQEPIISVASTRQANENTAYTRTYGNTQAVEYGGLGSREFKAAATDALLLRAGIRVAQPHPAARDLVGTSVADLARMTLSQQGVATRGLSASAALTRAFTHTTSDFSNLLMDSLGKSMMAGFEQEPASHRQWVHFADVRDFRPQTRVRLSDAPALLEVGEGGEITYGSFSDTAEVYQLITYARMFSISRQALVNDDLGAFMRINQAFGQSARRLESDKVYALLTDNGAMQDGIALFHASHNNIASGALSVASLSAGRALMRLQTGVHGGLLNIVPRYLVVPASLEATAEVLLASTNRVDPAASNDSQVPVWIRSLELVVEPRLDATSETGWYLAAGAPQADTIEAAYLESARGVFLEEEQHFTNLGVSYRAVLDFGCGVLDHKGLVYSPGT